MQTRSLILSLATLLGVGLCAANAAGKAGLQCQPSQEPSAWTISFNHQKVLVYAFAPQKFKPYLKELYTLKGVNVLRDSPFDHLHHHALMYGIKVNGINFWEEVSGCGVQKVIESPQPVLGWCGSGKQALPQAKLTQLLRWVAPQDAFLPNAAPVALLIERRTLVLTVNPATEEVALEWKSQFEVGNKTNTVVMTGANYHGLGVRFLQDLDHLAIHSLAGTHPDLANNRQDISAAPWGAVSFDAPGRPATFALAGHPSNARGDATFFSMFTPFSYLSATQALDKQPLEYHAGDRFELNYLVLLYPETKPSDALRQHMETWRAAPVTHGE